MVRWAVKLEALTNTPRKTMAASAARARRSVTLVVPFRLRSLHRPGDFVSGESSAGLAEPNAWLHTQQQ